MEFSSLNILLNVKASPKVSAESGELDISFKNLKNWQKRKKIGKKKMKNLSKLEMIGKKNEKIIKT